MPENAISAGLKSSCDEPSAPRLLEVPVRLIHLRPDRPRRVVSQQEIDDMANSLATTGLMQPVGVRQQGREWVLIYGYRRLFAARQLGWQTILAMGYPETLNAELIDLALWVNENLHQSSPQLDEVSMSVNRLAKAGMPEKDIATALGKPVQWVADMLGIARDPLARRMIEAGRLNDEQAWTAFSQLPPEKKKTLLDSVEPISLNRCQLAQAQKQPETKSRKAKSLPTAVQQELGLGEIPVPEAELAQVSGRHEVEQKGVTHEC